jgi:hypothetical protein
MSSDTMEETLKAMLGSLNRIEQLLQQQQNAKNEAEPEPDGRKQTEDPIQEGQDSVSIKSTAPRDDTIVSLQGTRFGKLAGTTQCSRPIKFCTTSMSYRGIRRLLGVAPGPPPAWRFPVGLYPRISEAASPGGGEKKAGSI